MKQKAINYNTLRSISKFESLIENCSKYSLSRTDFPFIGEEPKNISVLGKPKNYHSNNKNMFGNDLSINDEELPNLIFFSIGGLAHNEITALERLQIDKKINHHLIKGSTNIITANEFLNKIEQLPLVKEISDGKVIELKSIKLILGDDE